MLELFNVLSNIKRYRGQVLLVILFNVLYSIFTVVSIPMLIPFFQLLFNREANVKSEDSSMLDSFNQYFINIIDTQGREQALLMVIGIICLLFFLKNLSRYLAIYFMAPIRTGVVYDLRKKLYDKYLNLPFSKYVDFRTGDLISRITADVSEVEISIIKMIEIIFKSPLVIIGSIAFMIYISPQLTLFVLFLILVTIFVIGKISKTLKRKSTTVQERMSSITSHVEETISSMKVIKAYNAQQAQAKKFEEDNFGHSHLWKRLIRRQDLSSPLSEFMGITIVLVLMWYGAQLVFAGSLMPETFFAFVVAFYQVIDPAKSFSNAYFNIQKGLAAYDRVNDYLTMPSESLTEHTSGEKPHLRKSLEIRALSFSYEQKIPVLRDINLTIKKGENIALVGTSGGGKTTLVDVIVGLYPITHGDILLDGRSMKEYSLKGWRELFGIVTQMPILFHDSIFNNINFACDKSMEEVVEAAKLAQAHDFIMALPEGYETVIGDKGMKLSGGQRQRITIARAILADPEILVLDEATSSLDSESEKLVQVALEKVTKKRTAIIIAHRLSTVKKADRIIVMQEGAIIDHGTHEELLEKSTVYEKLVQFQSFQS